MKNQVYAIKVEVDDPDAVTFEFDAQKSMYGGKNISEGDSIFIFASENQGGRGLTARGVVTFAEKIARIPGVARQTPRVSITIRRDGLAKRTLGRRELKVFSDWDDGRPETELNFKFYRQATNKIAGISEDAAAYLTKCDSLQLIPIIPKRRIDETSNFSNYLRRGRPGESCRILPGWSWFKNRRHTRKGI
jgi:hypothetical protein